MKNTMTEETTPKRKRSTRETPEIRRKSLIQATMRSIAKYGYSGTTIEKICEEAQISRGLVNHHFKSKEELINQSYKELCAEWEFQTHGMLLETYKEPEDKLYAMIRMSFSPMLFKQEYLGIWVGFWSVIGKSPSLKKLNRTMYAQDRSTYQTIFEQIAKKRGIEIDARSAAVSLIALTDGLWLEWCLDSKGFTPQEAETACLNFVKQTIASAAVIS
jgi:TetR/AcrR family transcriptional repressor of bet genes